MTIINAAKTVYSMTLSAKARIVYMYLAMRSNKENTCFPAKGTISRECNLSESSVARALAELVLLGLVEKTARYRKDKGCSSNLYLLSAPESEPAPTVSEYASEDPGEVEHTKIDPPCQTEEGEGFSENPQELVNSLTYTYSCKTDKTTRARNETRNTHKDNGVSDPALRSLLERCNLDFFRAGQAHNRSYGVDYSIIFRKAILHLYYAKHLRVGQVCLPREHVRACLQAMDWKTLYDARNKLEYALERSKQRLKVRNSTAYAIVVVYNSIAETQSDFVLGVS